MMQALHFDITDFALLFSFRMLYCMRSVLAWMGLHAEIGGGDVEPGPEAGQNPA